MVPAEFVAQDHAYRMLRLQLGHDARSWRDSVNIAALSEALGLSRTPVREALFRLLGEGILEPADNGGYRLLRPDAQQLRDLYGWTATLLLSACSMVADDGLRSALDAVRARQHEPVKQPAVLFQAIADNTFNREFSRQISNVLDRLTMARVGERTAFTDLDREAVHLLSANSIHVRTNIARRVKSYFHRRIEYAEKIAMNMVELP